MNIFKIISINFIAIILLLFSFELYASLDCRFFFEQYIAAVFQTITPEEQLISLYKENQTNRNFRENRNINSKKKPIIIMGDSFAYGLGLTKNETPSHKISKLIDNPIYNRSFNGWGPKQMLYQFRKNYIYQEISEPKYVLYFFIADHIGRIKGYKSNPMDKSYVPAYKEIKRKLVEIQPKFINKFILPEYLYLKQGLKDIQEYKIEKTTIYFNEAKNAMKKHWKNTKLVIIIYPRYLDDLEKLKKWSEEMRQNGFVVINLRDIISEDLTSKKYQLDDDFHPNAEAWDVVLPPLLKELNLL